MMARFEWHLDHQQQKKRFRVGRPLTKRSGRESRCIGLVCGDL